uniref:Uncharacterized protein n=1 Tax=Rhizophora mucronata TaxID=61149 RepID=A0A2P2NA32_RHIMU
MPITVFTSFNMDCRQLLITLPMASFWCLSTPKS